MSNKPAKKIIVILGPTSSGKTGMGVRLAQKLGGEIVSADSRQVYKGMNVGTGKDLKEYIITDMRRPRERRMSVKIPYHLIDVVGPKTGFNLAKYQKLAYKAINNILSRKKPPLLVGGTGLYLQAVVDGYNLAAAKPDKKLRIKLEKMSADQLFKQFKKLAPQKEKNINPSDRKNKRRLIRCIEIESAPKSGDFYQKSPRYEALVIGLNLPKEDLRKKIYNRLIERLEKENMVGEVKRLHKQGVSWKRLHDFGLEYRYVSLFLQGKLNYNEMVDALYKSICQFAKRQMTWFRRWEKQGRKIHWVGGRKEAEQLINNFLK